MVRSRTWALARGLFPVAVVTVAVAGCELVASTNRDLIPKSTTSSTGSGGSGGSGGATATSTSTATSSAAATTGSGGIECLHAATCPGTDTDCQKRTCDAGHCGLAPSPVGTPTSKQLPGDCKREVCDAAGFAAIVNDDKDTLADGNPCTADLCAAGVPTYTPSPAGSACNVGGGKVCDGANTCVGCIGKAQCGVSEACLDTKCISITCLDMSLDGAETDVDCGGPACKPCGTGKACQVGPDCASHLCAGTCQAPSCTDGVKNGAESDVDCGGGCAKLCGVGLGCVSDGDCLGGACGAGACLPTCNDLVADGAESDVDCGGSCAGCALGKACNGGPDCASGTCTGNVCVATTSTCANGALDGTESDIDCGGSACVGCAVGGACAASSDCLSGRCASGVCAEVVLISEARTRGAGGSLDELVELYNPGKTAITLDGAWTLSVRSAVGACATDAASVKLTGAGQTLPPHGHLLIVGSAYTQSPAGDTNLMNGGIADAGSLALYHGAVLVDVLCYAYDAATLTNLASCAVPYVCNGSPASNQPHDNTVSAASNVDASLERKPGGAQGNQVDTGDNLADFKTSKPARPQNLVSPAVP
ncbi:MAG: lamin tail domain-containing protein [Byssovorax sp.]